MARSHERVIFYRRCIDLAEDEIFARFGIIDTYFHAGHELSGEFVDRSIWLCGKSCGDMGRCREFNDAAHEIAAASGGRVSWLASVPPIARGAADEIARAAELGALGVGELDPAAQGWSTDDLRETYRLAGACEEHGLFALVRAEWGKTSHLLDLARAHPSLVMLSPALGGGLFAFENDPALRDVITNVFYCTAMLPTGTDALIHASLAMAPQKTLFGSAARRGLPAHIGGAFSDLMHGNARRLLARARGSKEEAEH